MTDLFRKPLFLGLVALIIAVAISSLFSFVASKEARATSREKEAAGIRSAAGELTQLQLLIVNMEATLKAGEPVARVVENVFAAEQMTIAATQSAGITPRGPYQDNLLSVRFQNAALGPLHRIFNNLEASRSNILISEVTIRKSVDAPSKLDAELVIAGLETVPESK